ncbi:hypothetical protein LG634_16155 [Streptomyces bambusae]|uniref:hypothetical protein n=1 Tax=Streptomyces bambusae TaxID=1550616 RepID=UPI001CFD92EB|nr:hypothetical protein [Streptomyces bambusae]MCB5166364.1 hypothetical protein [Streptomyces bambusae]
MNPQRSQGRGWVRIPASRGEQPADAGYETPYDAPYADRYTGSYAARHPAPYPSAQAAPYAGRPEHSAIYLSLVERWREAGRTLPGHPDEEWERLISQPCWPGP